MGSEVKGPIIQNKRSIGGKLSSRRMTSPEPEVRRVSRCFIQPKFHVPHQPCYLAPWDIVMLSAHYIQKGLLFLKPPLEDQSQATPAVSLVDRLKDSLSSTLVHFLPLAGRLVTEKHTNPPSYAVYVDCNASPGAEFIHAVADATIADILSPIDVPPIVRSFFVLDGAVNHVGHTVPLLIVQVTELLDGVFIGCSFNHVIGDGTAFWNFFNAWSEITRAQAELGRISRQPIHDRWFLDGPSHHINLPFTHHDEFIERYAPPPLRERIFQFSAHSISKLKARANKECNTQVISSFQALSALVWRSITKVRLLPSDQKTTCTLAIDNRSRLNPPLPRDYFGNSVHTVNGTASAGELLEHDLGWASWLLHEAVVGHTDDVIRESLKKWMMKPAIYQIGLFFDRFSVMMGSSPRFDMYGNDFGWGKAVAVRSGFGNKFDGKVSSYQGREGVGSVALEVCLPPDTMSSLETDEEFMDAVTS